LSLEEVETRVRQRRDAGLHTQVGYKPGWRRFLSATYAELSQSRTFWKWRDPDRNQGKIDPNNWIEDNVFLRELQIKRSGAPSQLMNSTDQVT
jgi:hypothetical protein